MSSSQDQFKLARIALALSKRGVFETAAGGDLKQAEGAQLVEALKAYTIGQHQPDNSNVFALEQVNFLEELADKLNTLNANLEEAGADAVLTSLFNAQTGAVSTDIDAYEGGLPLLTRLVWGAGNTILNSWDLITTFIGPDEAQIPRNITSQLRTVTLLLGYLMSPTANSKQILDMSVQRSLMILPGTITYTIAIALDVYGSAGYSAANIASSLATLIIIVLAMEQGDLRMRHTIRNYIKPGAGDVNLGEADLSAMLNTSADEISELQALIRDVSSDFTIGAATNNHGTHFNSAIDKLINGLRTIAMRQIPEAAPNVDRAKKWCVVGFGGALVGGVLLSSYKNPSLMAANLQWAVFYLYRLVKSAVNPSHRVRDTMELFCNAGAMMLLAFPLVSVPLLTDGPHAFKDRTRLVRNTALLVLLNSLLVHKIGPAGLVIMSGLAKLVTWMRGMIVDNSQEAGEDTHDWGRSLESLLSCDDEEFPHVFTDLLGNLDSYEKGMRSELDMSNLKQAAALEGDANIADMLSFMDLKEDTAFLAGSRGGKQKEIGLGELYSAWAKVLLPAIGLDDGSKI